jgi:hypothetical protein
MKDGLTHVMKLMLPAESFLLGSSCQAAAFWLTDLNKPNKRLQQCSPAKSACAGSQAQQPAPPPTQSPPSPWSSGCPTHTTNLPPPSCITHPCCCCSWCQSHPPPFITPPPPPTDIKRCSIIGGCNHQSYHSKPKCTAAAIARCALQCLDGPVNAAAAAAAAALPNVQRAARHRLYSVLHPSAASTHCSMLCNTATAHHCHGSAQHCRVLSCFYEGMARQLVRAASKTCMRWCCPGVCAHAAAGSCYMLHQIHALRWSCLGAHSAAAAAIACLRHWSTSWLGTAQRSWPAGLLCCCYSCCHICCCWCWWQARLLHCEAFSAYAHARMQCLTCAGMQAHPVTQDVLALRQTVCAATAAEPPPPPTHTCCCWRRPNKRASTCPPHLPSQCASAVPPPHLLA